jgi:ribA/ribD-fused uncharacterized protein
MTTIMQFHSKAKLLPADSIFSPTAMRDLSNFSEFDVEYEGFVYRTIEHAYQALKYLYCSNKPELFEIVREENQKKDALGAKESGGRKGMEKRGAVFDRDGCWDKKQIEIMTKLVASKIERHPEIRKIVQTAKENNIILVHFSRSDMIWGAHVTEDGKSIKKGTNHLGNIYMSFYDKLSSKPLVKVKKTTTKKSKDCPEGKVRNEKTGRCITATTKKSKDCPEGKVRNEKTGRCITVKTVKPCPEGKVRNEKTGRCITFKNKKYL